MADLASTAPRQECHGADCDDGGALLDCSNCSLLENIGMKPIWAKACLGFSLLTLDPSV